MTERGAVSGMDPAELWRQWMESGSRMWSEMARGAQEGQVDPYGVYRRWFDGMREMQKRMVGAVPEPVAGNPGVQDLWQRWFEMTSDSWRKSAEMGQNAMEILPRWMQMLDEARTNLLAGGTPPSDPLQLAAQWYNATSGPFSDFVGDVIEREEFLEPSSRFLQSYASFYKVFKRNSEEYLKNLQIPVRSDITRIAGLVVNLEEKVDRIEEVLEDFEYGYAEPATAESGQGPRRPARQGRGQARQAARGARRRPERRRADRRRDQRLRGRGQGHGRREAQGAGVGRGPLRGGRDGDRRAGHRRGRAQEGRELDDRDGQLRRGSYLGRRGHTR